MKSTETNPFENFCVQIDNAGRHLPAEDRKYIELLKHPQRILQFSLPVQMDSGELRIFTGYRVQHSDIRGPTKGGIRFHPDLNLDEVTSDHRLDGRHLQHDGRKDRDRLLHRKATGFRGIPRAQPVHRARGVPLHPAGGRAARALDEGGLRKCVAAA